jgi:hypothetical protein
MLANRAYLQKHCRASPPIHQSLSVQARIGAIAAASGGRPNPTGESRTLGANLGSVAPVARPVTAGH